MYSTTRMRELKVERRFRRPLLLSIRCMKRRMIVLDRSLRKPRSFREHLDLDMTVHDPQLREFAEMLSAYLASESSHLGDLPKQLLERSGPLREHLLALPESRETRKSLVSLTSLQGHLKGLARAKTLQRLGRPREWIMGDGE